MRLGYSINRSLLELWPYDPWSRRHMVKLCDMYSLTFELVPTTMGTEALKFNQTDFDILLFVLDRYEVNVNE